MQNRQVESTGESLQAIKQHLSNAMVVDVVIIYDRHQPQAALAAIPWPQNPQIINESKLLAPLGLATALSIATGPGGILVGRKAQTQPWTEAEIHLLQLAAFDLEKDSLTQQLATQQQHQTLISQITQTIRDNRETEKTLEQAIALVTTTLGAIGGLVLILKYRQLSWKQPQIDNPRMIMVSTLAKTPEYRSPHFPENEFCLADSPPCCQALADQPQTTQSQNLVITPMIGYQTNNRPRVLGFLVLDSVPPPLPLELLETIGNLLGTSLIQYQTMRQIQSLVDERTAQLKMSLEVQSKLYEKIRQQIDQLRQANQMKDDFISAISHELRTPLTSMRLAIKMLRHEQLSPERQAKYLEVLDQQCHQEVALVNDLLALRQLEAKNDLLSFEPVNLADLVQDAVRSFEQHWSNKGLAIDLQIRPRPENWLLHTHADSLRRIVAELFTNAGKYSNPDTPVLVEMWQQDQQVYLSVTNNGSGIPPEEQEAVFEKFHRGKVAIQQAIPGTGLGLALVKALVDRLDGSITLLSTPGDSGWTTCFTLSLPQILDSAKV